MHIKVYDTILLVLIFILLQCDEPEFLKDLLEFIKSLAIKEIIMLSSCHAYQRMDEQMQDIQVRYLSSNYSDEELERLK